MLKAIALQDVIRAPRSATGLKAPIVRLSEDAGMTPPTKKRRLLPDGACVPVLCVGNRCYSPNGGYDKPAVLRTTGNVCGERDILGARDLFLAGVCDVIRKVTENFRGNRDEITCNFSSEIVTNAFPVPIVFSISYTKIELEPPEFEVLIFEKHFEGPNTFLNVFMIENEGRFEHQNGSPTINEDGYRSAMAVLLNKESIRGKLSVLDDLHEEMYDAEFAYIKMLH